MDSTVAPDDQDTALAGIISLLKDGMKEWRHIRSSIETLRDNHEKLTDRMLQLEDWSRRPFSKRTVKKFLEVVSRYYHGVCPCCGETKILNRLNGKNDQLELDHFKGAKWNKITEGWPVCKGCHGKLTHGYLNRDGGWVFQAFGSFQMRVAQHTTNTRDTGQQKMFGN